jgi:hypothetical protein
MLLCSKDIDYQRVSTFFRTPLYNRQRWINHIFQLKLHLIYGCSIVLYILLLGLSISRRRSDRIENSGRFTDFGV